MANFTSTYFLPRTSQAHLRTFSTLSVSLYAGTPTRLSLDLHVTTADINPLYPITIYFRPPFPSIVPKEFSFFECHCISTTLFNHCQDTYIIFHYYTIPTPISLLRTRRVRFLNRRAHSMYLDLLDCLPATHCLASPLSGAPSLLRPLSVQHLTSSLHCHAPSEPFPPPRLACLIPVPTVMIPELLHALC